MGRGATGSEPAAHLDACAVGGRRPAGEARARDAAGRAPRLAARVYVFFAFSRTPGQEFTGRCRGLPPGGSSRRRRRGARRVAADGARLQQTRRLAGADPRARAPRRAARPHLGDRFVPELAAVLADATLVALRAY